MLNTACVKSVFPTGLSFDPDQWILNCLQHYMGSEHVTLTCEPAQGQRWLHGEHHGVGVPLGETWGQMTEIWTTPAATHRQMTGLQLRVEDREHIRPHFVNGIYSGTMFNWLVFINSSPENYKKTSSMRPHSISLSHGHLKSNEGTKCMKYG